ncbi:hypothetical protein GCM10009730_66490 [Streptomyces albidochromogenes]
MCWTHWYPRRETREDRTQQERFRSNSAERARDRAPPACPKPLLRCPLPYLRTWAHTAEACLRAASRP